MILGMATRAQEARGAAGLRGGDPALARAGQLGSSDRARRVSTAAARHLLAWLHRMAPYAMLLAVALLGVEVRGQCKYLVTVIHGPTLLGLPPPVTIARGINNLGHIVGYYYFFGPDCAAFLWTPEIGLVTLSFPVGTGSSAAYDINDSGQIVGSRDITNDGLGLLGFLRDGENYVNIGTAPGGNFSEALSINEKGQIVGHWGNNVTGNPDLQAFLFQDGQMTNLAPALGTVHGSASAINNSGSVVGWFGQASWLDAHAFIWQAGRVTDLGVISGGYTGEALAINDTGTVVGRGFVAAASCPFAWHAAISAGKGMIDLGTLPNHQRSRATGVNSAGQVVGIFDHFEGCSEPAAFLWQNGVMTNLNELVTCDSGTSISIEAAWAINDSGQIAGYGVTSDTAAAVLLTPIDPPLGDLDLDCRVGILDFLNLLIHWGESSSPADLDGDGIVAIVDLLILLGNWS